MTINRRYTNDDLLQALRHVAARLGSTVLSSEQYKAAARANGLPTLEAVRVRFGTWRDAIVAAGLQSPYKKGGRRIPCVVCGGLFLGWQSPRLRKTCSEDCRRKLWDAKGSQRYRLTTNDKYEHILIAERALGKPLPKGAEVHHVNEDKRNNRPSNLVICQDRAYHALLHRRARVLRASGNPNTQRICYRCHELVLICELTVSRKRRGALCYACARAYKYDAVVARRLPRLPKNLQERARC